MSNIARIFRNSFWLMTAEVFTKGISFLIFVILARHFGPRIYGQLAFALSFVGLFVVLVDFGFTTLTIQQVARDKSKSSQYIDNILAMKLILGLITLGLIAFIVQFLDKEPAIIKLVYFLAFYVIINNFSTFFQSIFRAYEKMQYEALFRAAQSLILLALSGFFILANYSILAVSYAYVISSLIGVFLCWIFVQRYFLKFFLVINWKICRKILKQALPFLLSGIFYIVFFRIAPVILGIFSNMEQVGYYNAAFNIFIAIFIIPEIITMSFFPKLSYFYENDKMELRDLFLKFKKTLIIIAFPITLVLFLFSNFIIIKIYTPEYSDSALILKILSAIVILRFLAFSYSWFLVSTNEQKQNVKIQGSGALLNIILSCLLVFKYKAIGAAFALLITQLFLLTLFYLFFKLKWNRIYLKT